MAQARAAAPASASEPVAVAFPHAWANPEDPELSWDRDDMHMPFALAPLSADYIRTLASGFNPRYDQFGFPQRWKLSIFNGFAYFAVDMHVPNEQVDDLVARWQAVCRDFAARTSAWWRDEALPELQNIYDTIDRTPVDELSREALAEAWDAAWAGTGRAWAIHFVAIMGPYTVLDDLADLYEKVVPGAAPDEPLRLIQGASNELQEVEAGVERLADIAAAQPETAARLRAAPPPSPEDLVQLPGATEFLVELDAFLRRHGHLGQGHDDLALPSWGEEPAVFLSELGQRLKNPPPSSAGRRQRLIADSDRLADGVRTRLMERPEELARFERLLALAREIGPLTEGHNYWIDRMAQARLRAFVMRVARRLVREGVLGEPADILYLERGEVEDLIRKPVDRRALVEERREAHALQQALEPPLILGKPREAGPVDRFDGVRQPEPVEGVLKGTGASAGIVRGPARIALSSADFGRIQPGDIIVCPSSNPSWVPVFSIAAGLVTNTGGVLSHAAVVAREFGLPAVVGASGATDRIADGRLLEIDGTQGIVRLL